MPGTPGDVAPVPPNPMQRAGAVIEDVRAARGKPGGRGMAGVGRLGGGGAPTIEDDAVAMLDGILNEAWSWNMGVLDWSDNRYS